VVNIIPHMHSPLDSLPNASVRPAAARPLLLACGASALFCVLALTNGCVVAVRPAPLAVYAEPQEVVVTEAPPAPIVEYVGVAPGPGFFWIGGYYHWNGGRWAWRAGHYERPPHPGARWVAARYEVRGGRRVYIAGHWH